MIVRRLTEATTVEWGSGLSRRLLLDSDGMGFSIADTTVRPGTTSKMEYRNHLEAVYCIEGSGELVGTDGQSHRIEPGVMYALNKNDAHTLVADGETGLRVVCVFNPPLKGDERHAFDSDAEYSAY
ncbi:ectoine synthase [Amycolatopsis sp. NPDC059090]|uniref:ectoine synthase n=1 Tax=unclassified Amycolatopsis TaxID=2618356 RepID=UPI0036729954